MGRFKWDGKHDAEAMTVIVISERYRKGVPPVAGGSLDQSQWINGASLFLDGERTSHLGQYGAMALMMG